MVQTGALLQRRKDGAAQQNHKAWKTMGEN